MYIYSVSYSTEDATYRSWYCWHTVQWSISLTGKSFTQWSNSNLQNTSERALIQSPIKHWLPQDLRNRNALSHTKHIKKNYASDKLPTLFKLSYSHFRILRTKKGSNTAHLVSCWQQLLSVKYFYRPQCKGECLFHMLHSSSICLQPINYLSQPVLLYILTSPKLLYLGLNLIKFRSWKQHSCYFFSFPHFHFSTNSLKL